jgi:hypothetical protein
MASDQPGIIIVLLCVINGRAGHYPNDNSLARSRDE